MALENPQAMFLVVPDDKVKLLDALLLATADLRPQVPARLATGEYMSTS